MQTTTLRISGMTCSLCSIKLEKMLKAVPLVKSVAASFTTETASVVHDGADLESLSKAVRRAGLRVDEDGTASARDFFALKLSVIFSALFTLPLAVIMFICIADDCCAIFDPDSLLSLSVGLSALRIRLAFLNHWIIQAALSFPVAFVFGGRFFRSAWYSLRAGLPGMDLLVSLGVFVSYAFSVWRGPSSVGMPDVHLYFESSAMIVTLVLFGKYLEAFARRKSADELSAITSIIPVTVHLVESNTERDIPAAEIRSGQSIRVKAGERVPADGFIIFGEAAIDESMLTGESHHVVRTIGDPVTAGTLAGKGSFDFCVTRSGDDTTLAKIIQEVSLAQSSRTRIQLTTDSICAWFTPFVLLTSLATFCIWYFIIFKGMPFLIEKPFLYAVSVLVVSCPCALGLAVPSALSAGIAGASRRKILVRDGDVFERAYRIDIVAFDKTGTVTDSKLRILQIRVRPDSTYTSEMLGSLVACAEQQSLHHFATAIRAVYADPGFLASDIIETPGSGVCATVDDKIVLAGTEAFLRDSGIDLLSLEPVGENSSSVHIAIDGKYEGSIGYNSDLRVSARQAVSDLGLLGYKTLLVSGDTYEYAKATGDALGVDSVHAEVSPHGKKDLIGEMQKRGYSVVMVGDGINDGPALALADVGIAMGSGTDLALTSGHVVLLDDNLSSVPWFLKWSRSVVKTVRANLVISFLYNIIAIPAAVTGNLNPSLACIAMGASSLAVVLNSLALGARGRRRSDRV